MSQRPVMLVILDGFGWREDVADNAVALASTPNFDRLWSACPRALLRTSGFDVGLPDGQVGNSEVGHLNIGSGRVVEQDLVRIERALADGSVARAPALLGLIEALLRSGGTCHLFGLMSNGGVHSMQDHAAALAHMLVDAGVPVALHVLTDGRDTPPESGAEFLRDLRAGLPAGAVIATIGGRYYTMDRDHRWERVERGYRAMAEGQGARADDPADAIARAYADGITDEFVPPTVIGGYAGMRDGDALLCFNYRADRVREILDALTDEGFSGFARPRRVAFSAVVGMTHYSDHLAGRMGVLFAPISFANILGEVVSRAGRTQLRAAETEKFPHVTYFLNGGVEDSYPGEDRILVPSPKVATYDLQPAMSAPELTDKVVAAIDSGAYDLIVLNYANPDMVGHTGVLAAAIAAVETVDQGLGRIADAIARQGGALLVTADHGNCEIMRDPETGGPHTSHTLSLVPAFLAGVPGASLHEGRLADLAPTLLALMGLAQPAEMTGRSLLQPAAAARAAE